MTILSVNAGSSTLKFALYSVLNDKVQAASLTGVIEGLNLIASISSTASTRLRLSWQYEQQKMDRMLECAPGADPFEVALTALQNLLREVMENWDQHQRLQAVAHRVVHGGAVFRAAVQVDAEVMQKLNGLISMAPLHQPHNLKGILAFAKVFPQVPQIACFDTAFHATLPEEEYRFALPEKLASQGIRRYGFHGLSYQSVSESLRQVSQNAQGRVIMAHLGNGASLCAMLLGKSRATTMGFSALDGLMMGTRSGALDPGVILHLLAQGWNHAQLEDLLYRQSGLLGVSGLSSDMRCLITADTDAAKLAVRMFVQRIVRECGAMAACIGGLDVLAFTGGIGENESRIRAEVCEGLRFLGLLLDQEKNQTMQRGEVSNVQASGSKVEVWVVPTDEGKVAAQAAVDKLGFDFIIAPKLE